MKKHFLILVLFLFLILNFTIVNAETYKTGHLQVIIKRVSCVASSLFGTIVNRSSSTIDQRLHVKVYDADNDPIGSGSTSITLNPKSGEEFGIGNTNCSAAKRYVFDLGG